MELRNKKTGEIGYLIVGKGSDHYVVANNLWDSCGEYNSLAELNEEWEDYEEPKEWWFIDSGGEVVETTYITDYDKTNLRKFGNYFETKEEAEKAVEKLKAWKRLKDKGIKTVEWTAGLGDDNYKIGEVMVGFDIDGVHDGDVPNDIEAYLNILFGGEE